jgi:hypothetical protein
VGVDRSTGSMIEFLGGPLDGEKRNVVGMNEYKVPIPLPITLESDDATEPLIPERWVHLYRRTRFKHQVTGEIRYKMVYRGEEKR